MIIIVDGPDFKNKEIICNLFKTLANYRVIDIFNDENFDAPLGLDDYKDYLEFDNVVFKNFHYYEIIRSRVKNIDACIGNDEFNRIEEMLKAKNAIIFHVTNKESILHKTMDYKNDPLINNKYELLIAMEGYDLFMNTELGTNKTRLETNLPQTVVDSFKRG